LTLATVTGGLVAEIIAGRPNAVPMAPFRADRFGKL
jgi:glycine/D-amino acid oxidase-like deaminating enzyme